MDPILWLFVSVRRVPPSDRARPQTAVLPSEEHLGQHKPCRTRVAEAKGFGAVLQGSLAKQELLGKDRISY
eukprot:1544107-Rhodomonas_salina.2